MAKPIPEQELKAIEEAVRRYPGGATLQQIANVLGTGVPRRTLQYRVKYLVDAKRLVQEGERRWAKYRLPPEQEARRGRSCGAGRIPNCGIFAPVQNIPRNPALSASTAGGPQTGWV